MSKNTPYVIGGIAAIVAAIIWLPFWLVVLVVVGVPLVGYLMLDPSQRKRLLGRNRKQLGP